MNPRTTVIIAVVAALLGGYIYFFEREPIEDTPDTEQVELFGVEAGEISEVEIQTGGDGEKIKLNKEGDSWQIVEPIQALADSTELDTLTGNIADLKSERVVAEGTEIDLENFGLAKPEIAVRFKALSPKDEDKEEDEEGVPEGEETTNGFLLGDETPTGTNRYAKLLDDDKVYVVSSYLKSNFEKKPWDLRDKRFLRFEPDDVERLLLRSPGGELVLAKESESLWNLISPSFCRADRYKASSLVSRFETAKMEEIVSENAEGLDEVGLQEPSYVVEIQLKGGKTAKLHVGNEKDGRFYARNPDEPNVFLISSTLVDDLKKEPSEYRSKRPFDYATYQVDKFQIAPAGEPTRIYEKTQEDEDAEQKWAQTAPESRELDRTKVEDLLYKLNGSDAEGFATDAPESLEPYGLDSPAFTISVSSQDGETTEELVVGKPGGEWVYARRQRDEPVLQLKASDWEEIEKLMSFEDQPEEEKETEEKEDPAK